MGWGEGEGEKYDTCIMTFVYCSFAWKNAKLIDNSSRIRFRISHGSSPSGSPPTYRSYDVLFEEGHEDTVSGDHWAFQNFSPWAGASATWIKVFTSPCQSSSNTLWRPYQYKHSSWISHIPWKFAQSLHEFVTLKEDFRSTYRMKYKEKSTEFFFSYGLPQQRLQPNQIQKTFVWHRETFQGLQCFLKMKPFRIVPILHSLCILRIQLAIFHLDTSECKTKNNAPQLSMTLASNNNNMNQTDR